MIFIQRYVVWYMVCIYYLFWDCLHFWGISQFEVFFILWSSSFLRLYHFFYVNFISDIMIFIQRYVVWYMVCIYYLFWDCLHFWGISQFEVFFILWSSSFLRLYHFFYVNFISEFLRSSLSDVVFIKHESQKKNALQRSVCKQWVHIYLLSLSFPPPNSYIIGQLPPKFI